MKTEHNKLKPEHDKLTVDRSKCKDALDKALDDVASTQMALEALRGEHDKLKIRMRSCTTFSTS